MRDFTYVDDIVESTIRVLDKPATADAAFDRQDRAARPASHPTASSTSAT